MKRLVILLTLVSVLGCQGQTKKGAEKQNTAIKKDSLIAETKKNEEKNLDEIRQEDYDLFKSYFKKEIKLPVSFKSPSKINENDTLSKQFYNKVIWYNQDKNNPIAKVYALEKDTLEDADQYDILDDETYIVDKKAYHTRVHPLGYINLDKNFECLVLEIRMHKNVFIDGYVFDKKGNIKSFMSFYQEFSFIKDYTTRYERDDEYERFVESSIEENKIIKLFIKNYGVSKWIDCRLEPDGYFKPLTYKKEGKHWWYDDDEEEENQEEATKN